MQPHERIRHIFYNSFRKLLISTGHDYLGEGGEFKPNFLTYFMYLFNAVGFITCIYTIIWYDVETGLNSIGYGAVNIQVKQNLIHDHPNNRIALFLESFSI